MSFSCRARWGLLCAVAALGLGACRFDGSGLGGSDLSLDLFGDVSPDIPLKFDQSSDLPRDGRLDGPSLPADGSSLDADGGPADGVVHENATDTPSPDTPSPDTLSPDTLSPDTLSPDTLSPDALSPDTLSPDTLSPDTVPWVCPPNKAYCQGGVRHVCNASGTGPVLGKDTSCDFICAQAQCRFPSNIPVAFIKTCTSAAPKLSPAANATVQISEKSGTLRISCDPDCGDVTTKIIDARPGGFCLSELTIPKGLRVTSVAPVKDPVTIFVVGAVRVAGTIALSGGSASALAAGGYGGPGGGAGGPRTSSVGSAGEGSCPGQAGQREGQSRDWAPGGGGGGGLGGKGGKGGKGRNPSDNKEGAGGAGGGPCASPELVPLEGGSGGGSGADGTCGGTCGWAGGGGGGAIQIVSRGSIVVAAGATMVAKGGAGYGNGKGGAGGGGGGGSGGAILLEARTISVMGRLIVDGGDGGPSGAGPGGAGATGATINGHAGASYNAKTQGGSGGGGGGGRVRLNAVTVPSCGAFVSPAPACSSGPLRVTTP